MTNINSTLPRLDILEGLEKNLRSGNLGHKKWDFSMVVDSVGCDTCGCAIGTLPYIFPNEFKFDFVHDLVEITESNERINWSNFGEKLGFVEVKDGKVLSKILSIPTTYNVQYMREVTPIMVADAIKKFLTDYRIRYPQPNE